MTSVVAATVSASGPWTLGVLVWLPICALMVVALLEGARRLWRYSRSAEARRSYDEGAARWAARGCVAAAVITIGLTVVSMYPYNTEFHQWRKVEGKVQKVSSRLIGTGDGMAQRFVVVIDGQPFGVDDTRASLVKEGDVISLRCKREFQYAADSGWACKWGGRVS